MLRFILALFVLALFTGCSVKKGPFVVENMFEYEGRPIPEFNRIVLETVAQYPTDGTFAYNWPKGDEEPHDGVTENLFFQGRQVMKAGSEHATYCCGITLEVFLKSYQRWVDEHGEPADGKLTAEEWSRFKSLWFVQKLYGPGPSAALEEFGLGHEIEQEEALPGDFVQIWRHPKPEKKTGSGHSVVFINWVRGKEGNVTGFRYWSSNLSTEGIAPNTEYFATSEDGQGIWPKYTYWARVDFSESE